MKAYLWAVPAVAAGLALAATAAFSEQEAIPDWVKNTAGWWADGSISDADYINSLQWLADAGYINLGGSGEPSYIHRESSYLIEQPQGWERQIPIRDPAAGSVRDMMVMIETIDEPVPAVVSIQTYPLTGDNMTAHREWGFGLVKEYLGDAFVLTSTAEAEIDGNPGYVDAYEVAVFGVEILGKSYSFEHQGLVYEIKYESDSSHYQEYLPEFERIVQTFKLE